jgi:GDP-L-fucose synthase
MRKIHEAKVINAKEVTVWGSGKVLREFIHVDDLASAITFVMRCDFSLLYKSGFTHLNVGTGKEISIRELAELVSRIGGFSGDLVFDKSMPDGAPRKLLDVSRINELGWLHTIPLAEGISATYNWYINKHKPKKH